MFQFLSSKSSFTFILLLIGGSLGILGYAQLNLAPFAWEFKNFLIGQNLNHGFRLYQDIRDNTGPLTANFFQLLDFFSISLFWNAPIAFAIVVFQAYVFQYTIRRFDLMPPMGNLPFFIYIAFFHSSFELFIPSGAILGLSFLLLAWREIIAQQSTLLVNDRVFLIGVYIGIACLCYLSYSLFIFWAILSLLFYSSINIRQILLLVIGFLMILISAGLVFSYHGNLANFLEVYQTSSFRFQVPSLVDIQTLAISMGPSLVLGIIGLFRVIQNNKIRSNAQKAQQTNLIWVFISCITLFTVPALSVIHVVFLLPSLAYFTLNIGYLFKVYWKKELLIWTLLGSIGWSLQSEWKNQDVQRLGKAQLPLRNEKLMVLGPQLQEYQYNQMVGPFLNWELSKSLFTELDQYKTIVILHDYFSRESPSYIYDPEHNFVKMIPLLPNWTKNYQLVAPNLYQRKN